MNPTELDEDTKEAIIRVAQRIRDVGAKPTMMIQDGVIYVKKENGSVEQYPVEEVEE